MQLVLNIDKKFFVLTLLLVMAVFLVLFAQSQQVIESDPWHPVSQIAKSYTDKTSIDADGDGIVDEAEIALNANNDKINVTYVEECNELNIGVLRYNENRIEYCNGIIWGPLAAVDQNPTQFNFIDKSGEELNTLVTTEPIIVTGFETSTAIVSGNGNPQVECNNEGNWAESCKISDGQEVRIRLTTGSDYETSYTATLTMGTTSDDFDVTTRPYALPTCKAWLDAGYTTDGIYSIDPDEEGDIEPFDAYCDQTTSGGGWTLVIGIALNKDHWNPKAVTPENLVDVDGKGKYNDTVINLIQNYGNNQLYGICYANAYAGTGTKVWTNCDFHANVIPTGNCLNAVPYRSRFLGMSADTMRFIDNRDSGCMPHGYGTSTGKVFAR